MKYISLRQHKTTKQTTLAVPVPLAEKLRGRGVELFTVKIEDGKLIYTPVRVVE